MTEVQKKIHDLRTLMSRYRLAGLRLRGVDWFSWLTGGGSSVVIFTSEVGVAEVFLTLTDAWILTSRIERDRLAQEEVPMDFKVLAFPWQEDRATSHFISGKLGDQPIASDRPQGRESHLPREIQFLKMTLSFDEVHRYRELGQLAAEAMTEALSRADPSWTEAELAGAGAEALWRRQIDPALVMVGGQRRSQLYRHPVATSEVLGNRAMMVFCARAHGLYANLTRFVFFQQPTDEEIYLYQLVAQVEAAAFEASRPGQSLSQVYMRMRQAYAEVGQPSEIDRHHQGGPTGYLSRELIATPDLHAYWKIENSMALAWNPSFSGVKIEDTVLVTPQGLEVLTWDSQWPSFEVAGRKRPDIWVRT
jgi:Xaa-Pro aminopeptidase